MLKHFHSHFLSVTKVLKYNGAFYVIIINIIPCLRMMFPPHNIKEAYLLPYPLSIDGSNCILNDLSKKITYPKNWIKSL